MTKNPEPRTPARIAAAILDLDRERSELYTELHLAVVREGGADITERINTLLSTEKNA